jgi:hypothetical protein
VQKYGFKHFETIQNGDKTQANCKSNLPNRSVLQRISAATAGDLAELNFGNEDATACGVHSHHDLMFVANRNELGKSSITCSRLLRA